MNDTLIVTNKKPEVYCEIDNLQKNTSQLADWQFKETIVEKVNELIVIVNEFGTLMSYTEEDVAKIKNEVEKKEEDGEKDGEEKNNPESENENNQ